MYYQSFLSVALSLLAYPVFVASASSKACYFPDGTIVSNDSPCFPDQADSMCCGYGHSCMSNGLCRWPDDSMPDPIVYIRGSCTDKSWKSGACPQHCQNQFPSLWDPIIGCPNNEYCCELDKGNPGFCCSKNLLFTVDAATTVTVIGATTWVATTVGKQTGAASSSPVSSVASTPLPGTNTSSGAVIAVSSANPAPPGASTGPGKSAAPTASTTSQTPAGQTKSSGASAKNGVGLSVGILITNSIYYLFM